MTYLQKKIQNKEVSFVHKGMYLLDEGISIFCTTTAQQRTDFTVDIDFMICHPYVAQSQAN